MLGDRTRIGENEICPLFSFGGGLVIEGTDKLRL